MFLIIIIIFIYILGLVVFDINTTDCDGGANKIVTYSITGGNKFIFYLLIISIINYNNYYLLLLLSGDSSVFHLNSSTGVITLTGSLDYEMKDSYQFEVKAMDHGSPEPLANFTQVITINNY